MTGARADLKGELSQKEAMARIKSEISGKNKKAVIMTYGCQQNESDSEHLAGMLREMGYIKGESADEADLVIMNTCAVRDHAEQRVFGNLGALKHLKTRNPKAVIAVCGCMPQQEHVTKKILESYRHVDLIFGTQNLDSFPRLLAKALERRGVVFEIESEASKMAEGTPVHRAQKVSAYVSVMYGCNNFCSYCIVPYVRGRERSRKAEDIFAELEILKAQGYSEVTLLGQNVNSYGKDLGDIDFAALLRGADKIGISRIRFMTSHPKDFGPPLIAAMSECESVCEHLHLPVQSGSNNILKAMNRGYTREDYLDKISAARSKISELCVTSDIIVGFPGESDEDFEDTLSLVKEVRYDGIFTFLYSPRRGTPAAKMGEIVPPEVKKERFQRLARVQNQISKEINEAFLGRVLSVLATGPSKTNPAILTGRTRGGKIVNFPGDESMTGETVNVLINESKTWSLSGEII